MIPATAALIRQACCIAIVFIDPKGDVVFLMILFNKIVLEFGSRPANVKVMIDEIQFVKQDSFASKKFEQVFRIIATMPDPSSPENLTPIDIGPIRSGKLLLVGFK